MHARRLLTVGGGVEATIDERLGLAGEAELLNADGVTIVVLSPGIRLWIPAESRVVPFTQPATPI